MAGSAAGLGERMEKPGPWDCMALASSASAGSHLLLVSNSSAWWRTAGAVSKHCDTHSCIVPTTEEEESWRWSTGSVIRQLGLDEGSPPGRRGL